MSHLHQPTLPVVPSVASPGGILPGTARRGFTLVEVLLALGVFALAAAAFTAALTTGVEVLTRISRQDQLDLEARFVLRQVAAITDEELLKDGGTFALPGEREVSWEASLEPTSTLGLFAVEIRLEQPPLEVEPSWRRVEPLESTLWIYLYRPGWGDPADTERLRDQKLREFEQRASRR